MSLQNVNSTFLRAKKSKDIKNTSSLKHELYKFNLNSKNLNPKSISYVLCVCVFLFNEIY